ncbi:MAG: hypothetical protein ABSA53_05610 [Streptosporangiaceae bacterium]
MAIPLPDLDDQSYADLTAQAQALIPALDPAWTNYNPSDPGITLVELLAWLTEMLLFQVNQVPPASTEAFLRLLNGPHWVRPDGTSLDDAIRTTILGLRERYRAVTAADFEWLALKSWAGRSSIARVHGLPRCDLEASDPAARYADAPAHVSLVVVPAAGGDSTLNADLLKFLNLRRTLTTRLHVVGPTYLPVQISADLALRDDAVAQNALDDARQALLAYYDPLKGGPAHTGWPFGRAVYSSEASAVLEHRPLLRYVENVQVTAPGAAGRQLPDGVLLQAGELVQLGATPLVAYDSGGQSYSSQELS